MVRVEGFRHLVGNMQTHLAGDRAFDLPRQLIAQRRQAAALRVRQAALRASQPVGNQRRALGFGEPLAMLVIRVGARQRGRTSAQPVRPDPWRAKGEFFPDSCAVLFHSVAGPDHSTHSAQPTPQPVFARVNDRCRQTRNWLAGTYLPHSVATGLLHTQTRAAFRIALSVALGRMTALHFSESAR